MESQALHFAIVSLMCDKCPFAEVRNQLEYGTLQKKLCTCGASLREWFSKAREVHDGQASRG